MSVVRRKKTRDGFCVSVINALEILSGANRPVDRTGADPKYIFNLIDQFKGILCLAVHFIDKSKNRDSTHDADFKQFDRLCLDTFGAVDHHDGRIGSHQSTIGIFREVLMSRSVQDVDTESVIIKLQYGGSDGDSSFFFDFHPVRDRVFSSFSTFYGTGKIDCSSI